MKKEEVLKYMGNYEMSQEEAILKYVESDIYNAEQACIPITRTEVYEQMPYIHAIGDESNLLHLQNSEDFDTLVEEYILNNSHNIELLKPGEVTFAEYAPGLDYIVEITSIDNLNEIIEAYQETLENEKPFKWFDYLENINVKIIGYNLIQNFTNLHCKKAVQVVK